MEQIRNKRVETHKLSGYYLEIENNLGNSIQILIQQKQSEKTYVADLPYDPLPQPAKVLFTSIDDLYDYIQYCIQNQIDLLRVLPDGSLQIGEVYKKGVRKVIIPTVQREEDRLDRLSRQNDQLSRKIDELTDEVRNQRQQMINKIDKLAQSSDEKATQIRLDILQSFSNQEFSNEKFREKISHQFFSLKEQLLNSNMEMEEAKINYERMVEEQKMELDQVSREIKTLAETLVTKEQLKTIHMDLDIFLQQIKISQNEHVALQLRQDQIQKELQRHATILKTTFSLIDAKRISFQVDTSLAAFQKNWKMEEGSKIIESIAQESYWNQVVSKNQLPKTGRYYFEVHCVNKCMPCFGIVAGSVKDKEWTESQQDLYLRLYFNGDINENGKFLKKVECNIKSGDLVSVLVDKQKAQIRWFVNYCSIAVVKLAQCFQKKPIYAFLGQSNNYNNSRFQCIVDDE